MPKFRKRPVVIEAFKWTGDINQKEDPEWMNKAIQDGTAWFNDKGTENCTLEIKTLEGNHTAKRGDYIIQGIQGELYPCKPDIFAKTYERVDVPTAIDRRVTNGLFTTKYTEVYGGNEVFNALHNFEVRGKETGKVLAEIHFQEGPIKECGVNGICNEDLLLMVITRLQMFQDSPYKCRENAVAITKLEEAAMWLRKRTMDREVRGVEGTHTV